MEARVGMFVPNAIFEFQRIWLSYGVIFHPMTHKTNGGWPIDRSELKESFAEKYDQKHSTHLCHVRRV